jgi:hypothetical protein
VDQDDRPPMPYVMRDDQPASTDEPPLKPDWKDFFALLIATYQVLLPPLLILAGSLVGLYILLSLLFR